MPAMLMHHEVDPRDELFDKLGDITEFEVFNDMVLLAIYERPLMTKSGIALPDSTRDEDQHQGKAAMVIKLGPIANMAAGRDQRGDTLKVGDWVAIRPSDGWPIRVNKVFCRMINEKGIHLRIPAPDAVW
jgi:co-chaperonin GroES (HSP10)